tara:strand:- start:284 stop:766 length:483 start_codon:yes stop_codon:yes gene_type:complete
VKKILLVIFFIVIPSSSFANSDWSIWLDFSLSDFCHLQPEVELRDNTFYLTNEEVSITATSICIYKDHHNQYFVKGDLKNGMQDGTWIYYYKNGQKSAEINYKNSKLDGYYLAWHENGQKWEERVYRHGKLEGQWTIWSIDGTKETTNWKDDKCISGDCD